MDRKHVARTAIVRFAVVALAAAVAPALSGGASASPAKPASAALQRAVASAGQDERIATWVFFADKGPVEPALREAQARLTPHARSRRERNRGAANLVDRYDVPVPRAYIDALRRDGAHIRHASRWLGAVSVDATPRAIDAIASRPFVARMDIVRESRVDLSERADPAPAPVPLVPPDPRATLSFNYGQSFTQNIMIDVPALHDLGYSGQGVMICMIDTGFNNLEHPAFANLDILVTHDFINGDSIVADQDGQMGNSGDHGTFALGAIGGFQPGELIGPAYGATYILAKTENIAWERHLEEDAWVAAAEWADSIGADIISSSVSYLGEFTNGETGYTWQDMDGATAIVTIGADIAASRGILVVNSAGNDGFVSAPANTLNAPGDGDSVLTVGAVTNGFVRTTFSSVGLSADGRIKPDVMAMGEGVHTVSPFSQVGFVEVSGTSMSCPQVAGAAALLLEARPDATNAQIMDALRQTANQAGAPGRQSGWGVIDAAAALAQLPTAVPDTTPPARAALGPIYPNPFNPETTIEYEVAGHGRVTISVFDIGGRRVTTLVDDDQSPGRRSVTWKGTNAAGEPVASGVYMVRLTAGNSHLGRKVVLLK